MIDLQSASLAARYESAAVRRDARFARIRAVRVQLPGARTDSTPPADTVASAASLTEHTTSPAVNITLRRSK